jgi:hypothetical protein
MKKRAKKKRDKVITSAQKNYCNNQIVFTSWIRKKEMQKFQVMKPNARVSSLVKHFSQAKNMGGQINSLHWDIMSIKYTIWIGYFSTKEIISTRDLGIFQLQ